MGIVHLAMDMQSPYNPYNPYIPGAVIAADGSYVATQQYYMPSCENGTSSPAYNPMVVQPGLETYTSDTMDKYYDMSAASTTSRVDPSGVNSNSFSAAGAYPMNSRVASNQTNGFGKVTDGLKSNGGQTNKFASNVGVTSNSFSGPASSQMLQVRGAQATGSITNGRTASNHNPLKVTLPLMRCLILVQAFFVIKLYSEDDVHKSIKYNVWSSAPNENKKLNSAYEEAQKISIGDLKGCPIFLCFSVNASGQFCGVAEMTGPVDFHKDMDFWQQDKWSGSFPPQLGTNNLAIQDNNIDTSDSNVSNVANGKPTEDVLRFSSIAISPKQKETTVTGGGTSVSAVSTTDSDNVLMVGSMPVKVNGFAESSGFLTVGTFPLDPKALKARKPVLLQRSRLRKKETTVTGGGTSVSGVSTTDADNVLMVGSMPVKVNGFAESSGFLTVGTIPLDPKALKVRKPVLLHGSGL
ncbi:hypothetical protein CTI12_AA088980 [Artemisia annua]|uniref:YTH domain-containing family protein n=1 Tax=Artemisia annua TaxID=35608 RepID=A0A2U1Q124_ARTAN|nr:hypothetical protein CTI12_AA088980 [Artemisia annua]